MAQMTPQDFTATYGPLADDIAKATGLDPSVVLGQAAQETGWGNHVSGHNIFGISPGGKVAAYPDIPTAAQAYVDLINGRYAVASKFAKPEQQARAITQLGYNPDPAYGDSVSANASRVRGMRADTAAPSADDLLSRMQTLTGGAKPAAASAAPSADDLLSRMQTLTPATQPTAETAVPDTGSGLKSAPIRLPVPTRMMPTLAPDGPSANSLAVPGGMPSLAGNLPSDTPGTPGPTGSIDRATVGNALAIPPGRYNGTFLPWTADEGTGANGNISLPGFIRQPLQGLVGGIGNALTFNPETNAYGLSPEAQSVALAGANPLRFGTPSAPISLFGQPERDLRAAPLSADFRANPLAQPTADMPGMTARPGEAPAGPSPGMGGPSPNAAAVPPGPRAAGAEATSEPIPEPTPAQKATALQKMVGQSAEDRLTPQGRDDNVYFPGVERPEAMKDFSNAPEGQMSSALQHKALYNTDSHYHDQYDALVKKNNAIMTDGTMLPDGTRVDGLKDMFGDANTREAAFDEARSLMPGSVHLFDDEKATSIQPIADEINKILASGKGKIDGVANTLRRILPKLYDKDGNPETLPSQIKGIFDDINNKLFDKSPTIEGNEARQASDQLKAIKAIVSDQIGKGLPGTKWTDYLTNLSGALGKVNKLDYMQQFLTGSKSLWGSDGMLQFNKVNKMLEDIRKHSSDQTGGARQMTMDEINKIEAVRNELAAKDLLDKRAGVRGSPTVQLGTAAGILGSGPLGSAVKTVGEGALHLGLGHFTAGVGNVLLLGAKGIKAGRAASKDAKAANALAATKNRLLDTTPNPLAPP